MRDATSLAVAADLAARQDVSSYRSCARTKVVVGKAAATVQTEVGTTWWPRAALARMYDAHELEEQAGGVEVRVRMWLEGPLAFLWRRLVAEKVASGLPEQTARLIERAHRPDEAVRSPTR